MKKNLNQGKSQILFRLINKVAVCTFLASMSSMILVGCSPENSASVARQQEQKKASGDPSEYFRAPPIFHSHSKSKQGFIGAELNTSNATFDEASYNTVIYHVEGASVEQIVQGAKQDLDSGKIVILDSSGTDKQVKTLEKIAFSITGAAATEVPALRIISQPDKSGYEITPIYPVDRVDTAKGGENEGNTVKNLFFSK